jgi:hypothetical protein
MDSRRHLETVILILGSASRESLFCLDRFRRFWLDVFAHPR